MSHRETCAGSGSQRRPLRGRWWQRPACWPTSSQTFGDGTKANSEPVPEPERADISREKYSKARQSEEEIGYLSMFHSTHQSLPIWSRTGRVLRDKVHSWSWGCKCICKSLISVLSREIAFLVGVIKIDCNLPDGVSISSFCSLRRDTMLCEHDGDNGGGLDAMDEETDTEDDGIIEESVGGRFKLLVAVFRLSVLSDRSTGSATHSGDCNNCLR